MSDSGGYKMLGKAIGFLVGFTIFLIAKLLQLQSMLQKFTAMIGMLLLAVHKLAQFGLTPMIDNIKMIGDAFLHTIGMIEKMISALKTLQDIPGFRLFIDPLNATGIHTQIANDISPESTPKTNISGPNRGTDFEKKTVASSDFEGRVVSQSVAAVSDINNGRPINHALNASRARLG